MYQRYKGTKWLADILKEQLWDSPPVEQIKHPGRKFYRHVTAGYKATAVTTSQLMTDSRNRSLMRRIEKQNAVLPTVASDEIPSGLSGMANATKTATGFVNATKTAIKNVILDHLGDSSTSNTRLEMVSSDPIAIMDEEASAPLFWSCGPNEQPMCLMLKITKAHSDMVKCVHIYLIRPLSYLIPSRHMQFANRHNTSGFILATHSRGNVRLWSSQNGSNAIERVHGLADLGTTSLGSGYKRYAWAPDGSRLLTRTDRETKIWPRVC